MDKIFRLKSNDSNKFVPQNNEQIINTIVNEYRPGRNTLVYGAVQSGKTRNIINLIDAFFSNDKVDIIFYVVGNTNDLKEQNLKRLKNQLPNYEVIDGTKDKLGETLKLFLGEKSIVTVLKQHIEEMAETIHQNLNGKRVSIIDDEADDFSLSDKSLHAFSLVNSKGAGVTSVTATPFLNLYYNEQFYSSCFKLIAANGYSGIHDFDANIEMLETNQSEEKRILKVIYNWAFDILENKELFKDAQLLFNITTKNDDHDEYYKIIFEICERFVHGSFSYKEMNYLGTNKFILEEISTIISDALKNGIKIANSKYKNDIDHRIMHVGYEIIIGGIYLSRGITYENLLAEMMVNVSATTPAHTIIQRSRWCGYRFTKNKLPYKKFIKIYFDDISMEAYNEVKEIDKITTRYIKNKGENYKKVIDEISSINTIIKIR